MPRSSPEGPDFLALGHVTLDLTVTPAAARGVLRPGGAVSFGALTAQALGLRAAAVTSAAPSYPMGRVLRSVPAHTVPSPFTTFFHNIHGPAGERRQLLAARAGDICRSDVPSGWLRAPVVLLGPLARELPPDAVAWFAGATVGASIQGWMRSWDQYGRVREGDAPPPGIARGFSLLAGSVREFGGGARAWTGFAEVVAETDGARGCRIHTGGRVYDVGAFEADEVDPTGAGDVWAAAYLVRYRETGDALESARFANAAGSVSVEREGLDGAPTRADVEARMARPGGKLRR